MIEIGFRPLAAPTARTAGGRRRVGDVAVGAGAARTDLGERSPHPRWNGGAGRGQRHRELGPRAGEVLGELPIVPEPVVVPVPEPAGSGIRTWSGRYSPVSTPRSRPGSTPRSASPRPCAYDRRVLVHVGKRRRPAIREICLARDLWGWLAGRARMEADRVHPLGTAREVSLVPLGPQPRRPTERSRSPDSALRLRLVLAVSGWSCVSPAGSPWCGCWCTRPRRGWSSSPFAVVAAIDMVVVGSPALRREPLIHPAQQSCTWERSHPSNMCRGVSILGVARPISPAASASVRPGSRPSSTARVTARRAEPVAHVVERGVERGRRCAVERQRRAAPRRRRRGWPRRCRPG